MGWNPTWIIRSLLLSGIWFIKAYNCDVACKWLYPLHSSRFGPTMGQRSDFRCQARINTDLISIENETADWTTEPDAQSKAVLLGLGKVGECPRMIIYIGWQTNSLSTDIDTDTDRDMDIGIGIDICRDIDMHSFIHSFIGIQRPKLSHHKKLSIQLKKI